MSQSLSQVYLHIIFSIKNREKIIDDEIAPRLFEYIGGTCKRLNCPPIQVGGHDNHIHILCRFSKNISQSKLLEEIKKNSSKWIKTISPNYSNFYWQGGYGIFSVNPTQIEKVREYIINQKAHHATISFQEEFRRFLKKYKVDYDERYIWD